MGTGSSAIEKIKAVGNEYFSNGDFSKAIIAYSKALRYDPYNHILLGNRCAAYIKLNRLKPALEDAISCIKSNKSWHKAYYRLGLIFQALDLQSEALHYLKISNSLQEDSTVFSLLTELENSTNLHGKATLLELKSQNIRPTPISYIIGVQITEM